jgi:hypothetical protein
VPGERFEEILDKLYMSDPIFMTITLKKGDKEDGIEKK